MWRWIVRRKKAGSKNSIYTLKNLYLQKYDPKADFPNACYFCAFMCEHPLKDNGRNGACPGCPGCRVDKTFACVDDGYSFQYKPAAFLRKLNQLNRKRKASR